MYFPSKFDVIVVGGGHAGTEAALAVSRMGVRCLLLTHNIDTIGQMSCNPAIGGIGKGHLVKEIDAMGGIMAEAIDHAGIQFRTLNARKGPAVRATRAQADRALYKAYIRKAIDNQPHLTVFQQSAEDLLIEQEKVVGVKTQMGLVFECKAVILATGTFLGGQIHIGLSNYKGGRAGDASSIALAERLREMPFKVDRLKTGTPPRIDAKTIDFNQMEPQPGDNPTPVFSFIGHRHQHPQQVNCWITHTNQNTHDIIRTGLDRSPMYTGAIDGVGPRYCPSIEDKIIRFAERDSHQIFIEPEGLETQEVYPNGISTSLPFDVQLSFVRSIAGMENAHITRPGYAIEYDFFDPKDLTASLETPFVKGLFFAGQINGTTGYEEAAAQGLVAGINAALQVQEKPAWIPSREESYMGVMIDDLVTQGTKEPYRMFTSRAEYRLLLREDNADIRLTEKAKSLGLINETRWQIFNEKKEAVEKEIARMQSIMIHPQTPQAEALNAYIERPLSREARLSELLKRPELTYDSLMSLEGIGPGVENEQVALQVEVQAKYAGYIHRQSEEIARNQRYEQTLLPQDLSFSSISGLSTEVCQKLEQIKPQTLGQASRISGVTPAAISLILVYLKKHHLLKKTA